MNMLRVLLLAAFVLLILNPLVLLRLGSVAFGASIIESPTTISIPALGVSADIEKVGLDAQGNMDVPRDVDNTAWYRLGYEIGEKGNAVIAGHYNDPTGEPAVFYDLGKIDIGDKVEVAGDGGESITFEVKDVETYPTDDFPIEEVFGNSDEPTLALITCAGYWDDDNDSFSERVVVYAVRAD